MHSLVPASALQNGHMGGASGGSSSEDEGAGRDGAGGAQAKDDSDSEDENDFEEEEGAAGDEPASTRRWDADRSNSGQAGSLLRRACGGCELHAHLSSQPCHRVCVLKPADAMLSCPHNVVTGCASRSQQTQTAAGGSEGSGEWCACRQCVSAQWHMYAAASTTVSSLHSTGWKYPAIHS